MQFTFEYKTGQDFVTVQLLGAGRISVLNVIFEHFERLGGICPTGTAEHWNFPLFINSQMIQEIIHNTCFVCGGLMKDDNKLSSNFINSNLCSVKLFNENKIRKCSSCGHSHT